jgi:F0F1-type ATP synthase membrane subunit c/vacuolar-type H+-ATPase subunit K
MLTAKRFAVGVGLAIVLPMLVHFGVATLWSQPKPPTWSDSTAYRDQYKAYDVQESAFQQREFWIAVPLGLLAIVAGAFIGIGGVGPGLMFGGVFTAIDGYVQAWTRIPDSYHFVALLITFAILLGVGVLKVARESSNAPATGSV